MDYCKTKRLILLGVMAFLVGCASTPDHVPLQARGKTVCDSYFFLSMCVQDLHGDGTVDLIYFTDTQEVFMYQDGTQDSVVQVMPFHRCAVPLGVDMQSTANRILNRSDLSLTEELSITRDLISSYVAAKPTIDACNDQFEDATADNQQQNGEFSLFEDDWDIE
jgi:hypothetical protein